MKPQIKIFLAAVFLALTPTTGAAEGTLKWITELDVFLPAQAADGEESDLKELSRDYIADGGDSTTSTIETKAAIGGRLGILYPHPRIGDIGLSVGYISGPNSDIRFRGFTSGFFADTLNYTRNLSFIRAMVEYRKESPASDGWTFYPAFGVGKAFGVSKWEITQATNYYSALKGRTLKEKWDGFTWEASLGFARKMAGSDLTFAIRYAAFPERKAASGKDITEIKWNTFGCSVGLSFGGNDPYTETSSYRPPSRTSEYRPMKESSLATPEPAQAEEIIEEVEEELPPVDYDAVLHSAEGYRKQGDYQKALEEYGNALKALPVNDKRVIYVLERRGLMNTKLGNLSGAKGSYAGSITAAKKLNIADTTVINAYLGLAYAQEKTGGTQAAIRNYRKALQLTNDPGTKAQIQKALQRLER